MTMKPIEIFEYKQKWASRGYNIKIHSDLRREAMNFCKVQMFPHQWNFKKFTDVYEDTFSFEYRQDAESFAFKYEKWLTVDPKPVILESDKTKYSIIKGIKDV